MVVAESTLTLRPSLRVGDHRSGYPTQLQLLPQDIAHACGTQVSFLFNTFTYVSRERNISTACGCHGAASEARVRSS